MVATKIYTQAATVGGEKNLLVSSTKRQGTTSHGKSYVVGFWRVFWIFQDLLCLLNLTITFTKILLFFRSRS